jgi:leucyl-tRNA synthetase
MSRYNPFEIEEKWQDTWKKRESFKSVEDTSRPKYYVLEMLPYPSGNLHMGHVRNYTIGDVLARFKRAKGFNVLHPMGWDAFGLPAENAALQRKIHPAEWTYSNIDYMRESMVKFGWSYDWYREIATCDSSYYGAQQSFFIDLYNKGLVYQKKSLVNWDPVDNTVLANEQVIDGKGWRSGATVERCEMNQWFLKITDYADELLKDLETLEDWPDRVRTMQENWIGKSEGLEFTFDVEGYAEGLTVYTTRPDTLMGVTFCSVAAEHPLAQLLAETDAEAQKFIAECQSSGTALEDIEKADKKGYKTPYKAIHPITGESVPIYIANFVLMAYGTGAVMAVPAHDERDWEFATKYGLPIKNVIQGKDMVEGEAYIGAGVLVNSGEFDGMDNEEAKLAIADKIESLGKGQKTTNYRLRDWGISRQRYWGCPIPFVYCDDCGVVPESKENLPVKLPEDVKFDKPGNPLENHPNWKNVDCPQCGKKSRKETDTMDTFMDSSWYFARYCCPKSETPLDNNVNYWMPVDQYIGGIEHAILHLLYARFLTKALRDEGLVSVNEPFSSLLCQGMVLNNSYQNNESVYVNPADVILKSDGTAVHHKTGEKLKINRMEKVSKSKNNGIDPYLLMDKYGVDTLRLFMMFAAPPERDLDWSDTGVEGSWRFLGRLWSLLEGDIPVADMPKEPVIMAGLKEKSHKDIKRTIHKGIKKVTHDVEKFHFNTMISTVMELSNMLGDVKKELKTDDKTLLALYREGVEACVRLLNPVAPHITEEMWCELGYETILAENEWPKWDESAIKDEEFTMVVQMNGKLKDKLTVSADISKEEAEKAAIDAIQEHLEGLTVRKCIVVPKRLVNIVAN